MKVIYKSALFRLPLLRNYAAIVIGRWCYVKDDRASEVLIRHELIHQEQMDRHGIAMFYLIYLKDYLYHFIKLRNHDQAYQAIPFEREAFERETE